jgi:hypothetical protein
MQPVRFYKDFLAFYSKSVCWALRASCVNFEWASSLADSGYAKSEEPKGHSLVIYSQHTVAYKAPRAVLSRGRRRRVRSPQSKGPGPLI